MFLSGEGGWLGDPNGPTISTTQSDEIENPRTEISENASYPSTTPLSENFGDESPPINGSPPMNDGEVESQLNTASNQRPQTDGLALHSEQEQLPILRERSQSRSLGRSQSKSSGDKKSDKNAVIYRIQSPSNGFTTSTYFHAKSV